MRFHRAWAAASALLLLGQLLGADESGRLPLAVPDVPFVSQPEALCGGAALSMVARYWGLSAVQPEDFRAALGPHRRGITPEALTVRARALGLQAFAFRGEAESVRAHLARGRPLVVLLGAGSGRFHYVVLLAWEREEVLFHDPIAGPFRVTSEDEWQRQWSESDRFALLVLPSVSPLETATAPLPPGPGAEGPPETRPLYEQATREFRRENWAEASAIAARIVAQAPEDPGAWRLLATSRFLEGRPHQALAAWNAVGEPTIDLVRIDGTARIPPRDLEASLGLRRGALLTSFAWRRAERRLGQLPAVQSARLELRPQPGGRVLVEGAVLERRALPPVRSVIVDVLARAATEGAVGFDQTVLGPRAEALRTHAQWQPHRGRVLVAASAPFALGLPGVVGAQLLYDGQTYRLGGGPTGGPSMASERRRRASLSLHDWWTSDLMVGVEASADQWSGHAPALSVGTRVERRFLGDQLGLHGRVQGWWSQERPFYAGALGMGAQTATAGGRSTVRFRIALEWASPRAPLALWPGAGTGAGRDALLRGHPLIRGGIVTGAAFGRRLITGGVELERRVAAPAGMRVALALFLDGAQVAAPEGGPGQRGTHVDVGAGVRLALPGSDSVFRIDIAHPVRGSGVQLSAGWQGRLR